MKKNDVINIINILKNTYPDAKCSLDFTTPFELVVAVSLSAQCTDDRVNKTTPILFNKCKTIEDYSGFCKTRWRMKLSVKWLRTHAFSVSVKGRSIRAMPPAAQGDF